MTHSGQSRPVLCLVLLFLTRCRVPADEGSFVRDGVQLHYRTVGTGNTSHPAQRRTGV